jgi:adenylate cyclase
LQRIHDALIFAQELSHPYSLAFALGFAAWIHQCRREEQLAQERAEAAVILSTEQGFSNWSACGTITKGWAVAEQGQGAEGIIQICRGIAAMRAMGAEFQRSYFLALLAEAYGKVGQTEEGLGALAEALVHVDKTGERYWEAELYRLKGELSLAQSSVPGATTVSTQAEAEECFLKAIEISRKQEAKSLELRAVTSLVRLRQRQAQDHATRSTQHESHPKLKDAHNMLSEIYNWFTEGFDTKDLQEAKALLEELSR